jgi:NAD(P)-dependent dehydrogenase (short-subunit alcohol dehydrogenase family)
VTDDASVDASAQYVTQLYGRLDILVNNAGMLDVSNKDRRSNFRATLAVNVVGSASVTEAFLPLMRKSAAPRLVFVGSSTGSMTLSSGTEGKHATGGAMEYRSSKAALHEMMVLYNHLLKGEGFKVSVADPGLNATNLGNMPEALIARGAPDPSVGAERIAMVIRGGRDAELGKICGEYDGVLGVCPW